MLILASLVIISYGLAQIYFKDLWWWDTMLLHQWLGHAVTRTEQWDQQQNELGMVCIAVGLLVLFYSIVILL